MHAVRIYIYICMCACVCVCVYVRAVKYLYKSYEKENLRVDSQTDHVTIRYIKWSNCSRLADQENNSRATMNTVQYVVEYECSSWHQQEGVKKMKIRNRGGIPGCKRELHCR